jgi:hypothetical protein
MLEAILARIGTIGALAILLTLSVALNAWQFNRAGKADARCATRIAGMVAEVDRKTAELETLSLRIGRESAARAAADASRIQSETIRYVDRIRRVEVPVPAECHAPMPDSLQDALTDAARAANSFVRAR